MGLDLDSLKNNLNKFAGESSLTIIKEIGNLADKYSADKYSSVDEFKRELDKLCLKNIGKTSSEVLAEDSMRLPEPKTSSKPRKTENDSLQNELVKVEEKIKKLNDRFNPQQSEFKS